MKTLILMMLAVLGCAAPSIPHVQIKAGDPSLLDLAVNASNAWTDLGFTGTTEISAQDECPAHWTDSWTDCKLTVEIMQVKDLKDADGYSAIGYTDFDNHVIFVDSYLTSAHLQHTLTHELGHIFLDTYDHLTEVDQVGVMFYSADRTDPAKSWLLTPTKDDLDLANF